VHSVSFAHSLALQFFIMFDCFGFVVNVPFSIVQQPSDHYHHDGLQSVQRGAAEFRVSWWRGWEREWSGAALTLGSNI
jgi:hypothetical protein